MNDDKKPEPKPAPRLVAVKFDDAKTLSGVTPLATLFLTGDHREYEVAVVGASVFVRAPQGRILEVPRSKVTLSYEVPEGMAFDEAVRSVSGGKR